MITLALRLAKYGIIIIALVILVSVLAWRVLKKVRLMAGLLV